MSYQRVKILGRSIPCGLERRGGVEPEELSTLAQATSRRPQRRSPPLTSNSDQGAASSTTPAPLPPHISPRTIDIPGHPPTHLHPPPPQLLPAACLHPRDNHDHQSRCPPTATRTRIPTITATTTATTTHTHTTTPLPLPPPSHPMPPTPAQTPAHIATAPDLQSTPRIQMPPPPR